MTFLWELLAVLRAMQPVQLTLGPIHIGPLHINSPVDDDCCDLHAGHLDPDQPVHTARLMDDDEMYAFGEIVGQHFTDDEDTIRVACDTAMATLALEEAALRLEGDR